VKPPPGDYVDFSIRIWREAEHYFAQVMESAYGMSERAPLDSLFENPKQAETLMARLEQALLRSASRGSVDEKVLRDFGHAVFDAIFQNAKSISALYTKSQVAAEAQVGQVAGLRVRLQVDAPDLAQFPWEYLYNSGVREWLGLFHKSPIIRRLDVLKPGAPLELSGPLNILGMVANPQTKKWKPLEDAERERRLIDQAIAPHQAAGKVNFRWVPGGTWDALRTMMGAQDWHVFHFIGHGGVPADPGEGARPDDTDETPEGFIVLSDGQGGHKEVAASELKPMLQQAGKSTLRLVVLNCCESARVTAQNLFASPAVALVRAGIPYVVAMQFPIREKAAVKLASVFYEKLAEAWAIEAALTEARVRMWDESRIDWGIPVLYTLSRTGQLFVSTGAAPAAAPAAAPPAPAQPIDQRKLEARARLRELYEARRAPEARPERAQPAPIS
jgi:CHAT domain-containing protein